jgi:DNA-binding NarL/FixJ family response regulator
MGSLVPVKPNAMVSFFRHLRIDPRRDTFKIVDSASVISAHVKRPTGEVLSARLRAKGSLKQFTKFDPADLTVQQRRVLEREMPKEGMSQAGIANLLGVSQATVSLDLKRLSKGRQ